MQMDKIAGSGNDEFYTPRYAIKPLLKYLPKGKVIWCPFDTHRSLIVSELNLNGNYAVHTHLDDGLDFFCTPCLGEIIVSNPPYSKKTEVFKRLFELGVPFAMIVGVVGLFESEKRFQLFSQNDFEVMWLNKRISYFKSFDDEKPSLNPPFSSVWITRNLLPQKNVFEMVQK